MPLDSQEKSDSRPNSGRLRKADRSLTDFFLVTDSRQVYNGRLSDFLLESVGLRKSVGLPYQFIFPVWSMYKGRGIIAVLLPQRSPAITSRSVNVNFQIFRGLWMRSVLCKSLIDALSLWIRFLPRYVDGVACSAERRTCLMSARSLPCWFHLEPAMNESIH